MFLRKINAVISLLTTLLVLLHASLNAVTMLSAGAIQKPAVAVYTSWVLCGLMVLHALICIDMMVSHIMESKGRRYKKYAKLNAATVFQRISGGLLILFTALHVGGTAGPMKPPPVIHATVPVVFFTFVMAHVAVSTSKAFITLGIGNAKTVKAIDIAVKVICVITLIADIIGFYLYQV